MAKSPDEALMSMIENMPHKTGKPLEEWIAIIGQTDLTKHGQIVKHLKSEHSMTHGFANLVAHRVLAGGQPPAARDLLDAQFAKKADLRPIYDAVVTAVSSFGPDVEVSVKKTYVSLRRSKQFAIVQPSTKTRLDVGLNLGAVEPSGRLEASGSFNGMVSHRVRITESDQVDNELLEWLRAAYLAA